MSLSEIKLSILNEHLRKFSSSSRFDVSQYCFKEQLDFIRDASPFKTAVCSRRAGKTVSCAAHLIETALSQEKMVCLYITLSRANAKRIIWSELTEINRTFRLKGKPNETELSLTFPNKSIIYLSGANDKSEIDKFRGLPIKLCYIDECQSFRPYIENLVDEVISKALFDYNGTLCLIGTPGPVPSGYYYDCAHSKNWSHHAWTMFENPYLKEKSGKTHQELLERELTRKGVTIEDPTIQRECFGRWVTDPEALVFRYNPTINHYQELPASFKKWRYIVGVDLGFEDADALCVLGYNEGLREAYLCEEKITTKQTITSLVGQLEKLMSVYNPETIVMDTGGLGKKIAEEIRRRYSIGIKAAEKSRKIEYIEFLNDALRTKKFYAKKTSRFAQDCGLIEWDKDAMTPERMKISESYHSDICDAVLYAFRESYHWLYEPEIPKPKAGTPEWMKEQEKQIEENLLRELERGKDEWNESA